MKVVYVHDWLITRAGAEKVLEEMIKVVKADEIFTLFYRKESFIGSPISKLKITTSYLNNLPLVNRYYRMLLPFMPLAVEWFDLSKYDLVISSSHSVAKNVITFPHQIHICYCYTPMRYAWDLSHEYLATLPLPLRIFAHKILHSIRIWDFASSGRIDVFIANSKTVAKRIKRYYNREAVVIYPPVDVEKFRIGKAEDYFITVSRLVPYKKVDVIVSAFNELGLKLLVVGEGPEMGRIKKLAGKNIEILGWVEDDRLIELLSKAKAFVYCAYEDFGISPVEAMASGLPVIAYGFGGVSETVIEGETGIFFYDQNPKDLKDAVLKFLKAEDKFDRKKIREHSLNFSADVFRERFLNLVRSSVKLPL